MTGHLPEYGSVTVTETDGVLSITHVDECQWIVMTPELVQQIVQQLNERRGEGYVAGLAAARDAVAALPRIAVTEIDYNGLAIHPRHVNLEDALAAIDALRGES